MPLPGDPDAVRTASDQMAVVGRALQAAHEGDYPGRRVVAADGTKIGLREESESGGPTIDVDGTGEYGRSTDHWTGE